MKPIFKALTIAGSDSGGAAFCLLFRVCLLRLCLFFGLALGLGLTDRAGSGALADPRAEGIGIRKLSLRVAGAQVSVRVYFPSEQSSTATDFGPWRLPLVKNAPLNTGIYPLVMISHVLDGND